VKPRLFCGREADLLSAVPAFELTISQGIFHSKDLREKNLTFLPS
jgi:hypothetical protein